MKMPTLFPLYTAGSLLCLGLLPSLASAAAAAFPGTILTSRNEIRADYDYIIVGGGTSGLVVANRLSEDEKISVLVIEAGPLDDQSDIFTIPGLRTLARSNNSWPILSEPQSGMDNRRIPLTTARIVGGGSTLNGMAFVRGAPGDYDLWADLIGDRRWSWSGLLPYFKKSEHFSPPSEEAQAEYGFSYDMSVHGSSGLIETTYPTHVYRYHTDFMSALTQAGIPQQQDGAKTGLGLFWNPGSIDPLRRQRSYSTNHHEAAQQRKNYHLLTETLVTRLITEQHSRDAVADTPILTGVEFVDYDRTLTTIPPTIQRRTVHARKEIILAAGAVGTPKLLQLSGIGPKPLLDKFGIKTIIDLPGVGENFQDHAGGLSLWSMESHDPRDSAGYIQQNATYLAEVLEQYHHNRTGPLAVSGLNALALLTGRDINVPTSAHRAARAQSPGQFLLPSTHPTVIHGFEHQKRLILKSLSRNNCAYEIGAIAAGSGFTHGLGKPLSRGRIAINSTDPYKQPLVNWNTFTNPFDVSVLVATTRWITTTLSQAPRLLALGYYPTNPAPNATDAEIVSTIRATGSSSWIHPTSSCAMMRREEGGCVDGSLTVYGTRGRVRIVDASVMPVIVGAHTQATVYAVAERAADIIRGVNL